MSSHPVVAGHLLSAAEQNLMSYWLADRPGFRSVSQEEILRGRGGLLYQPDTSTEQLQELLEWNLPLLIVTGKALADRRGEFRGRMRDLGAAAIWELEESDAPLLPPPLVYEPTRPVFVLDDRQVRRRRYRQLLFYCGHDLRVDFRDSADLLEILRELASAGPEASDGTGEISEQERQFPALLLIDLDSERLDARAFFPALRKFMSDHPAWRRRFQIMLTKDFRRTGTDLELLAAHIRPLARRIFAPEEALFALLEGLLYSEIIERSARTRAQSPRPAATHNRLSPLHNILGGESVRLHASFPADAPDLDLYRQAQLFRWLYADEQTETGLLLSDSKAQR